MPYKITKKKGDDFSVVNKETGKVMSKGTTEDKAKKQIKAIYANMKPEHRIRHRIGLLEGANITDPIHRQIVKLARGMLMKEEIHGNGYWSKAWEGFKKGFKMPFQAIATLADAPIIQEGLMLAYPELAPLIAIAPDVLKLVLEEDAPTSSVADSQSVQIQLNPPKASPTSIGMKYNKYTGEYVAPYSAASATTLTTSPVAVGMKYNKSTGEYVAPYSAKPESVAIGDKYNKYTGEYVAPYSASSPVSEKEATLAGEKPDVKPSGEKYTERLDKLVEIVQDEVASLPAPPFQRDVNGRVLGLDDALRFPIVYNYDENNKPQYLQDFLVSQSVAGKNFAMNEFGNTYKNQKPYNFLNFPINGGKMGRINYSKLGYSNH